MKKPFQRLLSIFMLTLFLQVNVVGCGFFRRHLQHDSNTLNGNQQNGITFEVPLGSGSGQGQPSFRLGGSQYDPKDVRRNDDASHIGDFAKKVVERVSNLLNDIASRFDDDTSEIDVQAEAGKVDKKDSVEKAPQSSQGDAFAGTNSEDESTLNVICTSNCDSPNQKNKIPSKFKDVQALQESSNQEREKLTTVLEKAIQNASSAKVESLQSSNEIAQSHNEFVHKVEDATKQSDIDLKSGSSRDSGDSGLHASTAAQKEINETFEFANVVDSRQGPAAKTVTDYARDAASAAAELSAEGYESAAKDRLAAAAQILEAADRGLGNIVSQNPHRAAGTTYVPSTGEIKGLGEQAARTAKILDSKKNLAAGTSAWITAANLFNIAVGVVRFVPLVDLPFSATEVLTGQALKMDAAGNVTFRELSTLEYSMSVVTATISMGVIAASATTAGPPLAAAAAAGAAVGWVLESAGAVSSAAEMSFKMSFPAAAVPEKFSAVVGYVIEHAPFLDKYIRAGAARTSPEIAAKLMDAAENIFHADYSIRPVAEVNALKEPKPNWLAPNGGEVMIEGTTKGGTFYKSTWSGGEISEWASPTNPRAYAKEEWKNLAALPTNNTCEKIIEIEVSDGVKLRYSQAGPQPEQGKGWSGGEWQIEILEGAYADRSKVREIKSEIWK